MEYVIKLTWDNEANVWIATSDDIPGIYFRTPRKDGSIMAEYEKRVRDILLQSLLTQKLNHAIPQMLS